MTEPANSTTNIDRLADLTAQGISLWLDDLSRQRLQSGNLQQPPGHRRRPRPGEHRGRPRLAHETRATIEQAVELHKIVDRPNVLIKIPATLAGLPAITATIGNGISVNVTLIFSLDRYKAVMDASPGRHCSIS